MNLTLHEVAHLVHAKMISVDLKMWASSNRIDSRLIGAWRPVCSQRERVVVMTLLRLL